MAQPFVITVSSEKGGVGKTTVSINLAIFLKALREDLPVTLMSFDNHFSVDRMFRIGNGSSATHVGDLFTGISADTLVETGEFGVQFIPSSRELGRYKERLNSPFVLSQALASSNLEGVVIIDTRPDLDNFTLNAISSADRVIIPVKDTPSLENSRHIFEYADQQAIPRHRLKILPCLIDFRIQYDGPFKNPYQLMKAYAINRGYRCFENCISKSPKVESLNTNPDGKIFPVLTNGKGTDVHQQFAALASELLEEIENCTTRHLETVAEQLAEKQLLRHQSYQARVATLAKGCPLCGEVLVTDHGVQHGAAFYGESSNNGFSAFFHEACISNMINRHFLKDRADAIPVAVQELLRETYRKSYLVLRQTPGTRGFVTPHISLYRFDEQGLEISRHEVKLENPQMHSGLFSMATRFLLPNNSSSPEPCIIMRRVSTDMPESILTPENRLDFEDVSEKILRQFPKA